MEIYTDLHRFKARKPVVTIGTFDGVHRGHHLVLDRLKEIARREGGETVVFTFHPHPRMVLYPGEKNLRLLTTPLEKISLLRQAGIDHLVIYPFTSGFASMPYADFVQRVLVEKMQTHCLVVGYDHKFGRNREGGFEYLQQCADKHRFLIEKLDVLLVDEVNISSSHIRQALESGDIPRANEYLDYPYTLHGKVVEGRKLGRTIGFPTANIESSDVHKLIPGYGVYAVGAGIGGTLHQGMLNIGTRPTFNQNADQRSIEVNIFDLDEELYGRELTLYFIDKIRDEQKFPGREALVEQLRADRVAARRLLAQNNWFRQIRTGMP